jgi:hypothetical protein
VVSPSAAGGGRQGGSSRQGGRPPTEARKVAANPRIAA